MLQHMSVDVYVVHVISKTVKAEIISKLEFKFKITFLAMFTSVFSFGTLPLMGGFPKYVSLCTQHNYE